MGANGDVALSRIGATRPALSAWRFVTVFGVVGLLADVVYEGARSITGPLLASLGATGLVVGVVTGVGEAAALGLRLVSGPLADRSRRFWAWTIAGYTLTVVTVPLLGIAGALWVACALVIAERVGKAVRGPAKDTLLSHAASVTGRGRGFAVHEALDQVGAMIGPLTVAGMLAITGNAYAPALGVLTLPGGAALALLLWLQRRVPRPESYEDCPVVLGNPSAPRPWALPAQFWLYCGFTAITMLGFGTFGLLSFHMVSHGVLAAAMVPVVYAAAMAADALTALASGFSYASAGPKPAISSSWKTRSRSASCAVSSRASIRRASSTQALSSETPEHGQEPAGPRPVIGRPTGLQVSSATSSWTARSAGRQSRFPRICPVSPMQRRSPLFIRRLPVASRHDVAC